MTIMLICGSIAQNAHTGALLTFLQQVIEEQGHKTVYWDLGKQPLPIAQPEFHNNPEDTPDANVKKFVAAVRQADGFVLGSPLYHGSYSGALKNALDNLYYDAFRNKPVGLVSHSSNARNCIVPSDHLRVVVRALFGYPTQAQIGTTNDDYTPPEEGQPHQITNEEIKKRAEGLAHELLAMAQVLKDNPTNQRA